MQKEEHIDDSMSEATIPEGAHVYPPVLGMDHDDACIRHLYADHMMMPSGECIPDRTYQDTHGGRQSSATGTEGAEPTDVQKLPPAYILGVNCIITSSRKRIPRVNSIYGQFGAQTDAVHASHVAESVCLENCTSFQ